MTPHQGGDVMWAEVGWGTHWCVFWNSQLGASAGVSKRAGVWQGQGKQKSSEGTAVGVCPSGPQSHACFSRNFFLERFLIFQLYSCTQCAVTVFPSHHPLFFPSAHLLHKSTPVCELTSRSHSGSHTQVHDCTVTSHSVSLRTGHTFLGQKIKAGNSASVVSGVRGCFTRFHCGGRRLIYFQ